MRHPQCDAPLRSHVVLIEDGFVLLHGTFVVGLPVENVKAGIIEIVEKSHQGWIVIRP